MDLPSKLTKFPTKSNRTEQKHSLANTRGSKVTVFVLDWVSGYSASIMQDIADADVCLLSIFKIPL